MKKVLSPMGEIDGIKLKTTKRDIELHCFMCDLPTGNSLRKCCHFANSSGLCFMSLGHHNISKNASHGLTLLPLTISTGR